MKKYNVAVVGVGVVGIEILKILKERNFPLENLRVFARSSRKIEVGADSYNVEAIGDENFDNIDIALFAGTEGEKGASVLYAQKFIAKGAVVIDNGADFRLKNDVPLVVPEVNSADIKNHQGIIANPNCSTIQMVVALGPIHKAAGLKRIVVSSYQAVSGAGRSGITQLDSEIQGKDIKDAAFSHRIAGNVIPQIGDYADSDYTSEEWKMVDETHKILHDKDIKISATCVRVPVKTGHSEAIYLETNENITVSKVKELLDEAAGIELSVPAEKNYPLAIDIEGKDAVYVGRIRKDPFVENGLWLWVVTDNLRKGAALNAVQIAESLFNLK